MANIPLPPDLTVANLPSPPRPPPPAPRYSIRLHVTPLFTSPQTAIRLYRRVGVSTSSHRLLVNGFPFGATISLRYRLFESNTRRVELVGRVQHTDSRRGWSCPTAPHVNATISLSVSYRSNPLAHGYGASQGLPVECRHEYAVTTALGPSATHYHPPLRVSTPAFLADDALAVNVTYADASGQLAPVSRRVVLRAERESFPGDVAPSRHLDPVYLMSATRAAANVTGTVYALVAAEAAAIRAAIAAGEMVVQLLPGMDADASTAPAAVPSPPPSPASPPPPLAPAPSPLPPPFCASAVNAWPAWFTNDSDVACNEWAVNAEWGALVNGQSLSEACEDYWGRTNCAQSCCANGAYALPIRNEGEDCWGVSVAGWHPDCIGLAPMAPRLRQSGTDGTPIAPEWHRWHPACAGMASNCAL